MATAAAAMVWMATVARVLADQAAAVAVATEVAWWAVDQEALQAVAWAKRTVVVAAAELVVEASVVAVRVVELEAEETAIQVGAAADRAERRLHSSEGTRRPAEGCGRACRWEGSQPCTQSLASSCSPIPHPRTRDRRCIARVTVRVVAVFADGVVAVRLVDVNEQRALVLSD